MNQQTSDNDQDDDSGITLGQMAEFLYENWKKAVVGAVAGAAIGVGGWSALATYKAESVLVNGSGTANNGALSFMSWRGLQKNLPILAAQMVETKQVAPEQLTQYGKLSSAAWWQKNVVPTYSLTKTDTKDLATISKDLQDSGGTNILNLVVTSTGSSREAAALGVEITTRFIREGSAYLSIKNLVNGYESQVLNTDAELQKKILDAEVELKFMRERAKNLESLRQRFPANAATNSQQVVDLKDSNAKYMPISTQLVAVNTDINNTVESLQRMRDKLAKSKVLGEFVARANPIMAKETNGLALADALLKTESAMRAEIAPESTNGLQTVNDIEAALVEIRTSFTKGLETTLEPQVTKPSPIMPAVGGLFGGALAMLLYALVRRALAGLKSRRV